jgi:hypothetical protein
MKHTPFTSSPGYYTDLHGSPGRLVIKSPRGLIATMQAGYGQTREEDAARIVATIEAFPVALAALREIVWQCGESSEAGEIALAAIARTGGGTP